MPGLAQAIVGAGQRDGRIDCHTGVISWKVALLTSRTVHGVVKRGPATGAFSLRRIQAQLDGLAELVRHALQPLRLAPVGLHKLEDDAFYTVHEESIARMFVTVKHRRSSKGDVPFQDPRSLGFHS